MPPPPPLDFKGSNERRKDYQDFTETLVKIELQGKAIEDLTGQVAHLQRVADQFEELQGSLKTILWVARGVGLLIAFLFGDVVKQKLGL